MKNYSGNSTFASNGKFYFNGFNSRGFYGNQYVKAVRLESIGKSIIKVTGPADKFCNIYYIGKGLSYDISNYRKYGSTNGYSTVKAVSKWAGGLAGGLAGAKLGAVAGLSCGGIGTVPGSIIGGAAGGIFGAWGGSSFSETIIDRMYNIW